MSYWSKILNISNNQIGIVVAQFVNLILLCKLRSLDFTKGCNTVCQNILGLRELDNKIRKIVGTCAQWSINGANVCERLN
ncbi:hypothetical protein D3C86_1685210 [compost metagenome]